MLNVVGGEKTIPTRIGMFIGTNQAQLSSGKIGFPVFGWRTAVATSSASMTLL
jgi:hypothetical protein